MEALESRRRVLGNDHPDTIVSMDSLFDLYRTMGDEEKAASLLEEYEET